MELFCQMFGTLNFTNFMFMCSAFICGSGVSNGVLENCIRYVPLVT